ncbi:MAG: hypothetical protein ACREHE_14225 [Rhizomicrobium sp.]
MVPGRHAILSSLAILPAPVEAYDPRPVIAAVNLLQPLGKHGALDAIADFLDRADTAAIGLFWVLRVLFDPPPGGAFPPLALGTPDIPPPPDPARLPRFPVVLACDVPLLAVRGYDLNGLPEEPRALLPALRAHGIIRAAALVPSPQDAEPDFVRQWTFAYGDAQLDRALETIGVQCAKLASASTSIIR